MKPCLHNKIKLELRVRSSNKKYKLKEKAKKETAKEEELLYGEFFRSYNEGVKNKHFKPDVLPSLIKR